VLRKDSSEPKRDSSKNTASFHSSALNCLLLASNLVADILRFASRMSFRKRNVVIAQPGSSQSVNVRSEKPPVPGVRPSPLDGRPTTSTGTRSLDNLLAGHAGLAMGTSLLVEENGTTDFAGALLRYFAAEGIVQGHQVHVMGMNEAWGRELPAVAEGNSMKKEDEKNIDEKMKIAWRYERLGEFGGSRGGRSFTVHNEKKRWINSLLADHTFFVQTEAPGNP
jgi:hypothetical protein